MEYFKEDKHSNEGSFADDDVFNEIMEKLKSGEELWLPRGDSSDVVDLFKFKKYQGSIETVDINNKLFNAYRTNYNPDIKELILLNHAPVSFDLAANILLDSISIEA